MGTAALVEDLLLTDAFLIKGRVEGKLSRLSKMLDGFSRLFVAVTDVMMFDLHRGEVIQTPRLHVNLHELILAHELVETSGDFYQKALAGEHRSEKSVKVRAFVHGTLDLELAGWIRPKAYELGALEQNFFVMENCQVRGLNPDLGKEVECLKNLSYAIVHKERISYLYDFS